MKAKTDGDVLLNKSVKAIRQAVKKVINQHKRSGEPLIIWKNGKIVRIPSRELKKS